MDIIKKELFAHPRGDIISHKKRALVIGATGATGAQLLSLLLESNNWDKITTITRKPVLNGENHKKLNQQHHLYLLNKFLNILKLVQVLQLL